KLGFTSTNYFVVHQAGGTNVWAKSIGVPASPLMTIEQMRAWVRAGQEAGSHTLDHVRLSELNIDEAAIQIKESKNQLEELLDVEVSAFCYPYGDESATVRDMVRRAGYSNATTTRGGLAR